MNMETRSAEIWDSDYDCMLQQKWYNLYWTHNTGRKETEESDEKTIS